jgi:hypothetical protein
MEIINLSFEQICSEKFNPCKGEKINAETNHRLGSAKFIVFLSRDLDYQNEVCAVHWYLCTKKQSKNLKIERILRI